MCILTVVGIILLIVLVRYLWWGENQNDENPYMKKGQSMNPTPLMSSPTQEQPQKEDQKEPKREESKLSQEAPKSEELLEKISDEVTTQEEPVKQIEMIEVDTSHKELVKVEKEPLREDEKITDSKDEEPQKEEDEKPSFMEKPEGDKDDLKKISGIGPKIEEKLNAIGIFHYQQIADFTASNIQWVDNNLSFKGRIIRDDWVGQAKLLAKGEETEFSKRYKK